MPESLPTDKELTSRRILSEMAADIVDQCWSVHDQDSARHVRAEVLALVKAARVVRDLMSGKAVVQIVQPSQPLVVIAVGTNCSQPTDNGQPGGEPVGSNRTNGPVAAINPLAAASEQEAVA